MSRKNIEEEAAEKIPYDLGVMAKLFGIEKDLHCTALEAWMHAKYTLTTSERTMLKALHAEVEEDADYWNEEEMKIKSTVNPVLC